jgi:2-aminoadipate transaminase
MIEAKSNISICNDGLSQYAAAELFRRGDVARQIPKVTRVYRKKRDLMLETMEVSFPGRAKWNTPKGGLFLWVKMPRTVNADEMLMDAVKKGVAYMRLNYSLPGEADIVEGIQVLGSLLKEKLR